MADPKHDDERPLYAGVDRWKGQEILLTCWSKPCRDNEHAMEIVHHIDIKDDKEIHYCPTGFIWCQLCGGITDEPEPNECTRWGI